VQLPKGLPTIGVVALAAWAFFYPLGAWGFAAVEVVFLLSVALRLRKPAAPSREWASVLAAFGLSSLLLAPWLTYKARWPQAILIGVLIFAVAHLTRRILSKLSQDAVERTPP